MEPRYPDVEIQLVGQDGNAFTIMCSVRNALRDAGVSETERAEFTAEATSGDYIHLLHTVMQWVDVT